MEFLLWILVIMVSIVLYKIYLMDKRINWLKEIFISPYNYENVVNIPQEIFKLKDGLAPLFYLPLVQEARLLNDLDKRAEEEYYKHISLLNKAELMELEKFAQSGASYDESFQGSDHLRELVKEWAHTLINSNRVTEWKELYIQTLMDVLSGKVTVEQANKQLSHMGHHIFILHEHQDEESVAEIYNSHVEIWTAGKWSEHLGVLKKISSG